MKLTPHAPPEGTIRDWLAERAKEPGDRKSHIFTDGSDSLTWRDLNDIALEIARDLTALGIAKGESVAIMMPNGRDAVTSLFGLLAGGFRATIINLAAGAEAVGYALSHSEARFAIVADSQQPLFAQALAAHPNKIQPVTLHRGGAAQAELHALTPEDDALLMYTSGTTGRPKGVVHSHASLLAGGWTTAIAHDLRPEDRAYCVLPVYHINGLCVTVMAPLVSNGSVVMAPKFSKSAFWRDCATHEATWFSVVPTVVSHLVHGDQDPDAATKKRLCFGRSASSALAPDVQTAFETRFDVPIVETMGLTETAAQILSNPLPPGKRKIGSPGVAYGNEIAILGPDQTPLPPEQEGEIAVRGPNVMKEYLKNATATAETFAGDWLRTGDLGRQDADGYIFVTGRLKELIIKGGENIAPREIDEALYSHADVIEAAAFARPCVSYGERVEAAVKIRDGSNLTAPDLIAICTDKLGRFKCPDCIHILDDLPKGPSGKIQRLRLADLTR